MLGAMKTAPMDERGFTLIEIGITLAIVAILAMVAVPSYRSSVDKTRLKAAVDALHADLQNAKTLTSQSKSTVVVAFATGAAWCYGITSTKTTCSCAQTDSAQADFCEVRAVRAADVKGATLSAASFGGNAFTSFESVRGSATAGSATFQSTLGKQATVSVSALGRVGICSPAGATNVDAYPAC
jgi:type IV fimbrial biogenesis protein FimT